MLGALPIALVAAVGVASPAMAKGGTGGGGGGGGTGGGGGGGGGVSMTPVADPCAYFDSWTTSLETLPGQTQPWVALHVGVHNECRDEGAGAKSGPAVTETITDTATGAFVAAQTTFAQLTETTFTYYFNPAAPPTPSPQTITFTVRRVNGTLEDIRTTTAAEVLASAQPAA
jgi:hypothetical protein